MDFSFFPNVSQVLSPVVGTPTSTRLDPGEAPGDKVMYGSAIYPLRGR